MNSDRAEKKRLKKDALKAARNDTKKNFSVISKSFQNIIQLSRNEAFKKTLMNMFKISKETEIEAKILELLNANYSQNHD